jgi:hypothetical protein
MESKREPEEICRGHFAPIIPYDTHLQASPCEYCHRDEHNKDCFHYKPNRIFSAIVNARSKNV